MPRLSLLTAGFFFYITSVHIGNLGVILSILRLLLNSYIIQTIPCAYLAFTNPASHLYDNFTRSRSVLGIQGITSDPDWQGEKLPETEKGREVA